MDWQMLVTIPLVLLTFGFWIRKLTASSGGGCHSCPQNCQKSVEATDSLVQLQDLT